MRFIANLERFVPKSEFGRQLSLAAIGLGVGLIVLPTLIFFAGAALLGRYEGASLGATYASVIAGLRTGSLASWTVVLGPYGLFLLFKGLRLWWRASSKWV